MHLAERVYELGIRQGGEVALPAGPAPGALNERTSEAYLAHVRDVVLSPALVVPMGSLCSRANDGNAVKFADPETKQLATDFYFDQATGEATNSIGLKQFGIDEAINILPEVQEMTETRNKLLKVSLSTIDDEDASVVLPELGERIFEAAGDQTVFVEFNLGCPNKVSEDGGRHPILGLDVEATATTLEALTKLRGHLDFVGVKLSYYEPVDDEGTPVYKTLIEICQVIAAYPIDFVTLANTKPNQKPVKPDGSFALENISGNMGGGSGPAHAESSRRQLAVARHTLPQSIDVVSANGVYTGAEVRRRERAGAVFSEMVSRLWVPNLGEGKSYRQSLVEIYREYQGALMEETLEQ